MKEITVNLPFSKSISNRLLILQKLCRSSFQIHNLSNSSDTCTLKQLLNQDESRYAAGDGGTTFRFLLAYLTTQAGVHYLAGSERMNERPVMELIDALALLGANNEFVNLEGVNTLKINGGSILGGDTKVDVSRSSQFASAIMLIGPFLKNGLRLKLIGGKFVSRSYITMTLKILELAGVEVAAMGNYIEIPNQRVAPPDFEVECDWSSAAFWYQYVAHYKSAKINLSGLSRSGIQGDECMADFFKQLGVRTTQDNRSIIIEYDPSFLSIGQLQFDLADVPDLAPALILTCFGERIPAVFTGINHLQFKESDRIKSIASCINSLGGEMKVVDDAIILNDFPESFNSVIVNPFNDHRIAMAMAMFSATGTSVTLSDQNVVNKSYPEFWSHIELLDLPVTLV